MTNLDRLHTVSLCYDWVPRGAGRTTHDCHLVAGLIELGESKIICLLPNMYWLNHVYPMMLDILKEHGLPVQRTTSISFRSGNSAVDFVSQEHQLLGHKGPVVVFDGLGLFPEVKFHSLFDDYLASITNMIKFLSMEDGFHTTTLRAFGRLIGKR